MKVYAAIIRATASRFLFYPLEVVAVLLRRCVEIGFLILFWGVVARSSTGSIDTLYLVSYFLITGGLNDILMVQNSRFAQFLQKMIKSGQISNFLIRPVSTVPYLYASDIGHLGASLLFALVGMAAGMIVHPPASLGAAALFLVFLIPAFVIAFSMNILLGVLSFHITEAQNMRYVATHITKVFTGAIVPLYYFPDLARHLTLLTPFPYMLYVPVSMLKGGVHPETLVKELGLAIIWAVVLAFSAKLAWNRSLRHYDAVGL